MELLFLFSIRSCPNSDHYWEEPVSFFILSHPVFKHTDKISAEPSLFQSRVEVLSVPVLTYHQGGDVNEDAKSYPVMILYNQQSKKLVTTD